MRARRPARHRHRAQAALEMALVVPLMFLITIGFLGVMVEMRAESELRTAVDLAAQAAIVPPLGDTGASIADYRYAFDHTLDPSGTGSAYLTPPGPISCSGPYLEGRLSLTAAGTLAPVTCSASVVLDLARSPIGVLWPWSVRMSATARVQPSLYRACLEQTAATGGPCTPGSG